MTKFGNFSTQGDIGAMGNSTTAAGAPTTGTWARGDKWLDLNNNVWVCTVGGTPGTWRPIAPWVTWVAGNPNVVVAASQDFTLASFTMPFAGAILLDGQALFTTGGGATALNINIRADPSAASTPVPSLSVAGGGASMPADLYNASFPFSCMWGSVASGTLVTAKIRCFSSAPGVMGAQFSSWQATIIITPFTF